VTTTRYRPAGGRRDGLLGLAGTASTGSLSFEAPGPMVITRHLGP
jgi:hypothetical protein